MECANLIRTRSGLSSLIFLKKKKKKKMKDDDENKD